MLPLLYVSKETLVQAKALASRQSVLDAAELLLVKDLQIESSQGRHDVVDAGTLLQEFITILSGSPYKALDLKSNITDTSTIRKAYKKMALKYHPDKSAKTTILFQIVKSAHDKLISQAPKADEKNDAGASSKNEASTGPPYPPPPKSEKTSQGDKSSHSKYSESKSDSSQTKYSEPKTTNDFFRSYAEEQIRLEKELRKKMSEYSRFTEKATSSSYSNSGKREPSGANPTPTPDEKGGGHGHQDRPPAPPFRRHSDWNSSSSYPSGTPFAQSTDDSKGKMQGGAGVRPDVNRHKSSGVPRPGQPSTPFSAFPLGKTFTVRTDGSVHMQSASGGGVAGAGYYSNSTAAGASHSQPKYSYSTGNDGYRAPEVRTSASSSTSSSTPLPPYELRFASVDSTSVEITWQVRSRTADAWAPPAATPSDLMFEFAWRCKSSSNGHWHTAPKLLSAQTVRKKNLEPNTVVEFRVRAVDVVSEVRSMWSEIVMARIPPNISAADPGERASGFSVGGARGREAQRESRQFVYSYYFVASPVNSPQHEHLVYSLPDSSSDAIGFLLTGLLARAKDASPPARPGHPSWVLVKPHGMLQTRYRGEGRRGQSWGWCMCSDGRGTSFLQEVGEGEAVREFDSDDDAFDWDSDSSDGNYDDHRSESEETQEEEKPLYTETGDKHRPEPQSRSHPPTHAPVDVWRQLVDEESGYVYYHCEASGESRWEAPEWVEESDPATGLSYFVRLDVTNGHPLLSTWTPPAHYSRIIREG